MSHHLWHLSAVDLAGAIRDKAVSSEDVIRAHLERIEAVNPAVNAVTVVLREHAMAQAKAADASIAAGDAIGPLHGVPITVKEGIDVAGTATTQGIVSLKDSVPDHDAPVVHHLKAAGAIVIGRTNMPDYGMRWHTDNDLHGPTLNPWDPLRTPGGSSGGEAAAIATGMSPLGIGTDMAGSTRQPAICCGIAGLRPSTGRVSRTMSAMFDDPPMFYEQVACVNGPMARRVGDLRLALAVMGGSDPADPVWTPASAPPAPDPGLVRIGFVADPSGDGVNAAVADALDTAVEILAGAGYSVEAIEPPLIEKADDVIQRLFETEISRYIDDLLPMISKDAAKYLKDVIGKARPNAASYRNAIAERHRIARAWSLLMDRYPLVIGPVSSMETFRVGYDISGPHALQCLIRSFRLTELCNLIGLPSIAVPVCISEDVKGGLPQGVQIIGRRFDEDRCFDAAEVIEAHCGIFTPIEPRGKSGARLHLHGDSAPS